MNKAINAEGDALATTLQWAPMLPLWAFAALGGVALILCVLYALSGKPRAALWRAAACALFLLVMAGPSLLQENREPVQKTLAVIVDDSWSQTLGERTNMTETALKALQERFNGRSDIDLRIIRTPTEGANAPDTRLFSALEGALSDVPPARRAGVVLITDGQIHGLPGEALKKGLYGPVSALISGHADAFDRRIRITQAPSYGLVGDEISLGFTVEDTGPPAPDRQSVPVTVRYPDGREETLFAPVGVRQTISADILHAGSNIIELYTPPLKTELTPANNRTLIDVRGVRERLRVLLVSGKPHSGGRHWRDLLTSDPGVDLVHFTILREPEKLDATPQSELSLVPFPFRELFEIKLYDFDLIIFDRYKLNRILPPRYFQNIANFVAEGGALLEANGPAYAGDDSTATTALADVLPGKPTGRIFTQNFIPALSDLGRRHPVTMPLKAEQWGAWQRQIDVLARDESDILMTGVNGRPLLILNRVGDGRVAQITSDHLWLWARGYDGGGPHQQLMRRIVHWLMKEPELEERALAVRETSYGFELTMMEHDQAERNLRITRPDGTVINTELEKQDSGWLRLRVETDQAGLYVFEQEGSNEKAKRTLAILGEETPPERKAMHATSEYLEKLVNDTGGILQWLENSRFNLRVPINTDSAYSVTGVSLGPLWPPFVSTLLLVTMLTGAWWREGRRT